jgi:hypothetical protein
MPTIESYQYTFERLVRARAFRNAHCYAPESVMTVLGGFVALRDLVLIVDVDTLARSALARIDRVMMLALDALAHASVHVVLAARYENERAELVRQGIRGARAINLDDSTLTRLREIGLVRVIVLSDDRQLLAQLTHGERGIALGRPELASPTIASIGDVSVRATLWWMLAERMRAMSG